MGRNTRQLEELLRATIAPGSESTCVGTDDPVKVRIALYASLVRSAPRPNSDSIGRLLWLDNSGAVRVAQFGDRATILGRGPAATIRIVNPEISRCHCQITVSCNVVHLEDCGSANGTWINDQRVSGKTGLHDGDVIRAGPFFFVCAIP
jgi:hypothetical protein